MFDIKYRMKSYDLFDDKLEQVIHWAKYELLIENSHKNFQEALKHERDKVHKSL